MKQDFDSDPSDSIEELISDFTCGLVLTPFLTYPFTMYFLGELWSKLSFGTGLTSLLCAWVLVTIFIVQPGRDFLDQKAK